MIATNGSRSSESRTEIARFIESELKVSDSCSHWLRLSIALLLPATFLLVLSILLLLAGWRDLGFAVLTFANLANCGAAVCSVRAAWLNARSLRNGTASRDTQSHFDIYQVVPDSSLADGDALSGVSR